MGYRGYGIGFVAPGVAGLVLAALFHVSPKVSCTLCRLSVLASVRRVIG